MLLRQYPHQQCSSKVTIVLLVQFNISGNVNIVETEIAIPRQQITTPMHAYEHSTSVFAWQNNNDKLTYLGNILARNTQHFRLAQKAYSSLLQLLCQRL